VNRAIGTILLGVILMAAPADATRAANVHHDTYSPDGSIRVRFLLEGGRPRFSASVDGAVILNPSPLGFRFRHESPLVDMFKVTRVESRSFDETWEQVWGEDRFVRDNYNELLVTLRETDTPHREMEFVFRVFDDGFAFRAILPEQPNLGSFEIMSEETAFRFAGDYTAWWIPGDYDSYEHLYREGPLSEVVTANTPVTMKAAADLYLSVHEANLTDYAGMTLARDGSVPNALLCQLVPWPDGAKVKASTPMVTPWRTVQIGRRPGDLVESHLILNLNEPCVLEDTSWITPMKYVGIWWGMHIGKETWTKGPNHGATTENAKRYVDFASAHGIPGLLIEGWNTGWEGWGRENAYDFVTPYDDFDIYEVVRYATDHGVSIIGHHETGGDVPSYEQALDVAFALYERLGIRAVKTGYAGSIFPRGHHHHGQRMVNHYRTVVEKAARYGIMLDVHEPIKPTGIRRTYPHMMTREGVRGMEYNAWSEGNPPEHTTILPFTRMLAGPLDYTPGIFDVFFEESNRPENRVRTTIAKQLALYVVLMSPLQMAADLPENYEGNAAFRFIEVVPCDWDETRALDAEIGDYLSIARRSGRDWFLGTITDEEGRRLEIPLDFLEEGLEYHALIYEDAEDAHWETNPTAVTIREILVRRGDVLDVRLAPGGGQAVWFTSPEAGTR